MRKLSTFVLAFVLALTAGLVAACSDVEVPQKIEYTVTYHYNYTGSPDNGIYRTDTYEVGSVAKKPASPTRDGYTWLDWTVNVAANSSSYNFSKALTGNLDLYAQWRENASDEHGVLVDITVTAPTKTYYVDDVFDKSDITVTASYTDKSTRDITEFECTTPDMSTAGSKELTVTYKNISKKISITVEEEPVEEPKLTGIEVTNNKEKYTVGDALDITVEAVYDKGDNKELKADEYTVSGFDSSKAGDQTVTVTLKADTTISKTITVKVEEEPVEEPKLTGIEVTNNKEKYTVGDALDITVEAVYNKGDNKELKADEYTVSGFDSSKAGDQTVTVTLKSNAEIKKTITVTVEEEPEEEPELTGITAELKDSGKQYVKGDEFTKADITVTGTYSNDTTAPITEFDIVALPDMTTAGNKTVKVTAGGEEDTVTFYVKDKFNVTFKNGETTVKSEAVVEGGAVTVPAAQTAAAGYSFDGWKDEVLGTVYTENTIAVNADMTLVPSFGVITYTINYVLGDGTNAEGNKTTYTVKSADFTLLDATPNDESKGFDGWYTATVFTSENKVTKLDISIIAKANAQNEITLYANYTTNTYTVKFDANRGTMPDEDKEQTVEHGNTATEPAKPTREGDWQFKYWTYGGSEYKFTETVTGDITLTAYWVSTAAGTYLYTANGDADLEASFEATENNAGSGEWKAYGVTLKEGMKFVVRRINENGTNTDVVIPNATITQYHAKYAVTIDSVGGEFKVTHLNPAYADTKWTLYIKSTQVSLELEGVKYETLRNPSNTGSDIGTVLGDGVATDKVYIAGNFNEFKRYTAWSSAAEKETMLVKKDGNVYTFRNVYLTKTDSFKVIINSTWYGLALETPTTFALNTAYQLSDIGADNIYLGWIPKNGNYDIIVDSANKTYKIIEYKAPTLASIAVTKNPDKTEYWVGQPFVSDGLKVEATDTDGNVKEVEDYSLSENVTATVGNSVPVTVTYGGEQTATFNIVVKKITIEFDSKGGSSVATIEPKYGDALTAPEKPVLDGYDFKYWYLTDETKPYTFGTATESIELNAKWELLEYSVTYNLDGGTNNANNPTSYNITNGTVALNDATKTGYGFKGWYTSADFNADSKITALTYTGAGFVLYAKFEKNKYTVTFDANGGTFAEGTESSAEVEYQNTVANPADPSKTGYEFGGWFKDANCNDKDYTGTAYVFSTPVTGAFTLYAKWTANTYTITFAMETIEGKNYTVSFKEGYTPTTTYTYGVGLTLPTADNIAITGAGYKFVGWSRTLGNETTIKSISTTELDNITLYPYITDNETVDFIYDYCYDSKTETAHIVIGRTASYIDLNNTRTGWKFLGWYDKDDAPYSFGDSVMSATTIYAKWEHIEYTVTFDSDGGSDVAAQKLYYGDTVEKPADPTKTGYTFGNNWYKVVNGTAETTPYDFTAPVTGNITLKATWTAKSITVTLDNNGGSGATTLTATFDAAIGELPTPTKDGYKFKGWYNGNTKWETTTVVNVVTLTLTADWEIINYTVVYNVSATVDGKAVTATKPADGEYNVGMTAGLTLVAVNELKGITEGYRFLGWKISADDADYVTKITSNEGFDNDNKLTLNAVYEIITYTVTFDLNGGTGTAENQTIAHGGKIDQDKISITRDGWQFKQWEKDGEKFELSTSIVENVELVAIWTRASGEGTYLHIRTSSTGEWSDLYNPVEKDGDFGKEWVVTGVKLQVGSEFGVKTYATSGDAWVGAASGMKQYTYNDIITIGVSAKDSNFAVTVLNNEYKDVKWTLYIKSDGSGISLEIPSNKDEARSTDGKGTLTFAENPTDKIFIAGNFTNGFKYHQDWSTESTAITVLNNNGVYTFRGVYLKKNDAFKIVDNNDWLGGHLVSAGITVAKEEKLGKDTDNMTLVMITDGLYDIIYNTNNKNVKVVPYVAPTVAVTVTAPTKVTYWKGQPFDSTGMNIVITDSDGIDHSTEYDITNLETVTDTAGENKIITVTYNGTLGGTKTASFTITVNQIVVTFKNGDETFTTVNVDYNGTVSAPTDKPSKTGYNCTGWLKNDEEYNFSAAVTESFDLTAKWTKKTYTVTFKNDDNSVIETKTVEYEDTVASITAPDKAGHTFKQWNTSGGSAYDFSKPVTDNLVLVAYYTVNKYTVTFESDGGSAVTSQTIEYNKTVAKPADPSKDGYDFGGWLDKDGKAYDFATKVTEAITLTAKWDIVEYSITYYTAGTAVVDGNTVNVEIKTFNGDDKYTITSAFTLAKPEVTTAGVHFVAWHIDSLDGATISKIEAGRMGSLKLYAEYSANAMVKFTFDLNYEGAPVSDPSNIVSGKTAIRPTDPTRTGWKFLDWYDAATGGSVWNFNTAVTGDKTIYAHWEILKYSVSFDVNGGSPAPATQTIEHGSTATEPTKPEKEGCDFGGWFIDGKAWNFNDGVTKEMKLIANWTSKTYTVTFDLNYTGSTNPTAAVKHGNAVAAKDIPTGLTRSGYKFGGWYNEAACTSAWNSATVITSATTVYAKWIQLFTVTFDTDGGSTAPATQTIEEDDNVSKPADPTKTGYTFVGWFKVVDGTMATTAYDFNAAVTAAFTLKAKWEQNKTVTFNSNGGSAVGSITNVVPGATIAKPTDPTKDGYTFGGWYKESTLKNAWTFGTDGDKVNADTTLYAKWDIVTYTVTYFLNGGTNNEANEDSYDVTMGENGVVTLEDPSKEGYDFGGWFTSADFAEGTEITELTYAGLAGGTGFMLYAKWEDAATTYRIVLDVSGWPGANHDTAYTYHIHAYGGEGVGTATGATAPAGTADEDKWNYRDEMVSLGDNKYYLDLTATDITNIIFTQDQNGTRNEISRYETTVSGLTLGATKTFAPSISNVKIDGTNQIGLQFNDGIVVLNAAYDSGWTATNRPKNLHIWADSDLNGSYPGGEIKYGKFQKFDCNMSDIVGIILGVGNDKWTGNNNVTPGKNGYAAFVNGKVYNIKAGELSVKTFSDVPVIGDTKNGLYVGDTLIGALSVNAGNTADCTEYWFGSSSKKYALNKNDVIEFYIGGEKVESYLKSACSGITETATNTKHNKYTVAQSGEFGVYLRKWNDTGNYQVEFIFLAGGGNDDSQTIKFTFVYPSGFKTMDSVKIYVEGETGNYPSASSLENNVTLNSECGKVIRVYVEFKESGSNWTAKSLGGYADYKPGETYTITYSSWGSNPNWNGDAPFNMTVKDSSGATITTSNTRPTNPNPGGDDTATQYKIEINGTWGAGGNATMTKKTVATVTGSGTHNLSFEIPVQTRFRIVSTNLSTGTSYDIGCTSNTSTIYAYSGSDFWADGNFKGTCNFSITIDADGKITSATINSWS